MDIAAYIGLASLACSVLAAVLPVPAATGWTAVLAYRVPYAIINAVAVNHLNAANLKRPAPRP